MGVSVLTFAGILIALALEVVDGRALFVFGDSLVDNGNNNYLLTIARADYWPYGIDYPSKLPTGRFSNGLIIPDLISQALGTKSTLPYLSPELQGDKLLVGATFASAGVGILEDTGYQFVNMIRIYKQLAYFEEYQKRVSALIGAEETGRLVKEALILITLGGNDFVNNYFLIPLSPRSLQYRLPNYVEYLISEYQKILQRLYDLGARRVLVTGTGALGCAPGELVRKSKSGECIPDLQQAATLFNPQLERMLNDLNDKIGRVVFVSLNAQLMHMDLISNPQAFGFSTSKIACCGQGPYNGVGQCTIASRLCPNRDQHVYWDHFHPTEKATRIIFQRIMNGSSGYMHPMNLSTILALDSMPST